jgi:pyruvate dehydrogenase complex dehydrogenase (E1) component
MKTKNAIQTDKTVVEQLRQIRDKVSFEIKDLSLEELKDYLNKQKTLHHASVWR